MSKVVAKINALEPSIKALSDEALKKRKTAEFRQRLSSGVSLHDILPEAFAVVWEASTRTFGQRASMCGSLVACRYTTVRLLKCGIGEGKTLVATLPAYLTMP